MKATRRVGKLRKAKLVLVDIVHVLCAAYLWHRTGRVEVIYIRISGLCQNHTNYVLRLLGYL